AGAVHPADHLERRQLGIAGDDAGHPGHGPGGGQAARLVARHPARVPGWAGPGYGAGGDRIRPHRGVGGAVPHLRSALRRHRLYRGDQLAGRRDVGDACGIDVAFHPAPAGLRPCERVGAVRRHAGRRERPRHIFHRRGRHSGGDVALRTSRLSRGAPATALLFLLSLLVGSCSDEPPEVEPPNPVEIDESAITGCPPLAPISGFVGRGDAVLLLDSVTPFRSTGPNLYYLQQLLSYAQQDQDPQALQAVGDVLDDLVCLSLPVARICGVNDSKDCASIRRNPQEGFREAGLRGLDQAVWEAKRRGIRVILPLVNNWGEYGGLPVYAAWASATFGGSYERDDFF